MTTEPRFVSTTEQRLHMGLAANVWVAMDNIDTITDHVLGVLGTNRHMTKIHRYVEQKGHTLVSTGQLEVETGLHVKVQLPGDYQAPIDRWRQADPEGAGLVVRLDRGLLSAFGFSAHHYQNPTEKRARERYHGNYRRENVTMVRVDGEPGNPRLTDRIVIESWNERGVGTETTVAFEDDGPNDEVKRMADELLDVIDYGGYKTATYWTTEVVQRACQVLGVTVDQAKAGKRRPTV